jgi:carotenoid cleavage dioxygenase-like enzyme
MYYSSKYGDNLWVQIHKMTDNKTFFGASDSSLMTQINPDTLAYEGIVEWNDKKLCTVNFGITHPQPYIPRGSTMNVCPDTEGIPGVGKSKITLFEQPKDDPKTRNKIADIYTPEGLMYVHQFGITENYAIIVQHPVRLDIGALA